jgi:calcineurin-like phosphoesterase family protein
MHNVFTISDTHFGHTNILNYCDRPFKTVQDMDKYIIDKWNKTVTNDDTIIHCGDFALVPGEEIRNYAQQLNGHKILIRGNHDRKGIGFFESCGFEVIREKYYTLGFIKDNGEVCKYVFSHAPISDNLIPDEMINIHGHIHNVQLSQEFQQDKHFCVSCEMIDYTPLKLN